MSTTARIAVLIPCYNEEAAIAKVVNDFKMTLPNGDVYVYDNNSKDKTAEVAHTAGAIVRTELRRGKGNVIRRMFADIEADIYLLVDGDDTYDVATAPVFLQTLVSDGLDMVSGRRIAVGGNAYRTGHVIGNWLLNRATVMIFRLKVLDMLTGYRVFSRRFVKSFPVTAEGFSIETELTVHAGRLLMPVAEVDTPYRERAHGSVSKLHTWRDGLRIVFAIARLVREERPLVFFAAICALLILLSLILGVPVVLEYLKTGLVPRLPTAVLSMGLMLLAFLSLASGLILDTVTRGRWELKRLAYLAVSGPHDLRLP
ncbi:MAG: glycosyl transferase [Verrucomicrobia bacterium]|jgi:glycosyltransferase involved in cell wall biosynthesis|nr:MAG: glycosyl transferase [Verrucomicrobiota bacterium]PYJ57210.1 MAG: glycosyl transferase [Verrucomicrobiota bacterium]